MKKIACGGGWPAIWYALRTAQRAGGVARFLRAMSTRNACKTCALGMGGQSGGMVDESGHFPEVCKKSMQAMAADMQSGLTPEFFATCGFNQLRRFTSRDLESMGRIVQPAYAGPDDSHYQPIAWETAIERCIGFLRRIPPNEAFFYASGRSSNEAAFLLQLFARMFGTNNVNNCSYYCHQASGVGLSSTLGTATATVVLEDLDRCDLVFLIGGNPASNHPRLMRSLMKLRRRGGDVIVVNPIRETGLVNFAVPSDFRSLLFGSPIAGVYVQPHIGGDIAFLSGVAKRIDELGCADRAFIASATEGFGDFRKRIRDLSWKDIVERSGVSREIIYRVADRYASSERTIFAWTMGITHHLHGVDNVRAIVNLAMLRGMVGRPGAGLLPIRGHSNVQGVGSVGVTPQLKQAIFGRLESHFGVKLSTTPGMDTLSCMEAMHAGRLRTGWCLGGNLFGANPDAARTREAFSRLDSLVYFNTTLNTGHVHGRARETIILPMLARDEEAQTTTQESMFNYVRLSDGGPRRHAGPRSEVEAIATIARGVLGEEGPIDWRSMEVHRTIRHAIGVIVPGYEKIAAIDETKREFQIAGRTLHAPRFATATEKARFHSIPLPQSDATNPPESPLEKGGGRGGYSDWRGGTLRLMTIRSEGQFNTVVYENEDIYRHQERRDVVLMNPADVIRMGLRVNQQLTVRSPVGELHGILVREWDIREGNAAMYYPEANTLVPAVADPESRTPTFKSVAVTIEPDMESRLVDLRTPAANRALSGTSQQLNAC